MTMTDPNGPAVDPRTLQLEGRAATIGFALATDLVTNEALLAGIPVPRSKLNPENLRKLGEPAQGPDFVITVDRIDEYALRLAVANGDAAEIAATGLTTQTLEAFAAIDEPSAEPILGDEGTTLLSLGGMLVLYGDGGAGKTTMELDLVMHLASGTTWQGIPVHGQSRILIVENEGPRGMFRKKARAKLAAWDGQPVDERVHVLEDPWAVFSFADELYREHLKATIVEHQIDIVAAGPVNRLGISGGGTPEEVGAFILNIELIRQQLPRPLAVIFAHHENKAGDVSGAWEGVPDTLAHIQAQGHGKTRCHWQKCRWGPELHGKTWNLLWREGESFELEEKEEITDAEIQVAVYQYVVENPGCSWNKIDHAVPGNAARKRQAREGTDLPRNGREQGKGQDVPAIPRCVRCVRCVRPHGCRGDGTGTHPHTRRGAVRCVRASRQ